MHGHTYTHTHSYTHTYTHTHIHTHTLAHTHTCTHTHTHTPECTQHIILCTDTIEYVYMRNTMMRNIFVLSEYQIPRGNSLRKLGNWTSNPCLLGWKKPTTDSSFLLLPTAWPNVCMYIDTHTHTYTHTSHSLSQHRVQRQSELIQNRYPTNTMATHCKAKI